MTRFICDEGDSSSIFYCISLIKFVYNTVMILSFRTDRSGQTVQTQIRLLLEEQSDQGLHCFAIPFASF